MISGNFRNDGIVFHYDVAGKGDRHVVLQHGLSDYSPCWGDMIEDLVKKKYKVFMMDARGHGRSGKPDDGYDLNTMTADMVAFIREMKLNRPVIIGHSMGASMTVRAAAVSPNDIRAAVLIDPVFVDLFSEDLKKNINERKLAYQKMRNMSHEEIRENAKLKHPTWSDVYLVPYVMSRVYTLYADKIFDIQKTIDKGWREDLKSTLCPIMLITADKEKGAIIGKETSNWIKEKYQNIEILHVPNTGHNPHRENYPLVLDEISNFLKKQFVYK